MGLFDMFGGGSDAGEGYDKAMGAYEKYAQKGTQALQEHEATGRSDIAQYLKEGQAYGQPYRAAGESALTPYMGSLGLGGEAGRQSAIKSFQTSPGYRFALDQGLGGVSQGMAASGMRGSGLEQKSLLREATGLANKEYGGWQSKLAELAGMGQKSAETAAERQTGAGGSLAQLGYGYGGKLSDIQMSMGKAQADAELAKAQAEAESDSGFWGGLGTLAGGVGGWMLGGPTGAMAGAKIGGAAGKMF